MVILLEFLKEYSEWKFKVGRTTGLTKGIIQQIDVTAIVNYGPHKIAYFANQILSGAIASGGDIPQKGEHLNNVLSDLSTSHPNEKEIFLVGDFNLNPPEIEQLLNYGVCINKSNISGYKK